MYDSTIRVPLQSIGVCYVENHCDNSYSNITYI